MQDFVSRSEARTRGLKHYFNGKRCKHGHVSPRFVSTSACCGCSEGKPPDPPEAERRRLINDFKWDEDVRAVLIDEYVNTGDIMQAREMVKCSAAAYHRHLEENQEFAEAIKKATALAIQTLEDRSIHLAGKGNDKLIIATLKAKLSAEYSEKKVIEHKGHGKLSDAELDRRIRRLGGGFIIDGTTVDVIPPLPPNPRRIDIARYEARVAAAAGGEEAEDIAQPN
jgi:hypothetical protein